MLTSLRKLLSHINPDGVLAMGILVATSMVLFLISYGWRAYTQQYPATEQVAAPAATSSFRADSLAQVASLRQVPADTALFVQPPAELAPLPVEVRLPKPLPLDSPAVAPSQLLGHHRYQPGKLPHSFGGS